MKNCPSNDFSVDENKRNDSSVFRTDCSNQLNEWNQRTSQSTWATAIELSRLQPSTSSSFGYPTWVSYQNINPLQIGSRENTTQNDSLLRGTNTWAFGHLTSSTYSYNFQTKNSENSETTSWPGTYVSPEVQLQASTKRQPINKHPKKKDARFEVDFFKVQQSSANDPRINASPSHGMDLNAIAHLVKPPVETDGIGRSSQPNPVIQGFRQHNWHQELFECYKTDWKMLLGFARCPDITALLAIRKQVYRHQSNLLFCDFLTLPFRVAFLLIIILPVVVCKNLYWCIAAPFSCLSVMVNLMFRTNSHMELRSDIQKSYNIVPDDIITQGIISLCCERFSLCQMYSEVQYQKRFRGPEGVIIQRSWLA